MVLRLVLVRHGETQWNRDRRSQGQTDTALTSLGREQAELLARSLRHEEFLAAYTSPLVRAREMAERIASFHNLHPVSCEGLMELDHGALEGMSVEEMREKYGAFYEAWHEAPASLKLPDGESLTELQQRTWCFVEHVRAVHREGSVLAVSHNLAIRTILCKALEMDLNNLRRIRQDVACKNILEFREGQMEAAIRWLDRCLELLGPD